MSSPVGWARANVLYDAMRRPPRYGSLEEAALLLVWKTRRDVQIAGVRAQAQAAIGGDKALEAFTDFRNLINRVELEEKSNKMKEQLEAMKSIKEIRFQPLRSTEKVSQLPHVTRKADVLNPPSRQLHALRTPGNVRAVPPKTRR